jgi:hypothetical protein
MAIKYTNIFHRNTLQNLPKLVFLVWKQTIWQPSSELARAGFEIHLRTRLALGQRKQITTGKRTFLLPHEQEIAGSIHRQDRDRLHQRPFFQVERFRIAPMKHLKARSFLETKKYFCYLWNGPAFIVYMCNSGTRCLKNRPLETVHRLL